ncbi:MAG TPA: Crp/Fnr family transcriptional regulator [Burkholderiales bacterium]|nr:Crp/Fnr family transcriptional regulator [Burkholderiales bacterium]
MDARAQALKLYPVLQSLPPSQLDQALAQARPLKLAAGSVVFDERHPCQGFPMLLCGAIKVVKSAPNGRELQLYRVEPGESCVLTSSCLLGNAAYSARGIAEGNLELLVLPPAAFQRLLESHEPFRRFVFSLFSERLAELMQLVEEVAFRKLDQRLAALLLTRGRVIQTTHQAIADELGSVREIISRLLKGFAEQRLVALSREQVEVLDPAGLKRIADAAS